MTDKSVKLKVLIKGAGEIASGIAYALFKAGYLVCLTEIARPLAVSRATCYSEAIFDGTKTIEGVTAELVNSDFGSIEASWQKGHIPVIIDPETRIREKLNPRVVIDARMLKRPADTKISDAELVIGIGPGFNAGKDVHVVVESNDTRGNLGKLIYRGETEANTGRPIMVGGLTSERVVWASQDGTFTTSMEIGDAVKKGQVVGNIEGSELKAPLSGHLRGLIRNRVEVTKGTKIIEVDHINQPETYYLVREKMRVVGEAVAEAIKPQTSNFKNQNQK
jgi:xanthine dehydrogenase accessory factor